MYHLSQKKLRGQNYANQQINNGLKGLKRQCFKFKELNIRVVVHKSQLTHNASVCILTFYLYKEVNSILCEVIKKLYAWK